MAEPCDSAKRLARTVMLRSSIPCTSTAQWLHAAGLGDCEAKLREKPNQPYAMIRAHDAEQVEQLFAVELFTARDAALLWQYAHRLEQRQRSALSSLMGDKPGHPFPTATNQQIIQKSLGLGDSKKSG